MSVVDWLQFGSAGLLAAVMLVLLERFSRLHSDQRRDLQTAHHRDVDRLIEAHRESAAAVIAAIDRMHAAHSAQSRRKSKAIEALATEVAATKAVASDHAARDEADHRDLRAILGSATQ